MLHIFNDSAPEFSFVIVENKTVDPKISALTYDPDQRRLRSKGHIGTVLEMNTLMSKSFEVIAPLGSPELSDPSNPDSPVVWEKDGIFFAPDFPEFLLPLGSPGYQAAPAVTPKVITWGIVRKEPGTMSGTPFGGTQEIKPRHREFLAIFGDHAKQWVVGDSSSHLAELGELSYYIKTAGQAFDNLVQYNIWAKSNYEVEEMTEWFEEYMDTYRGMFREAGIVQTTFNRRVRDDTMVQMRNSYHVRSVLYYVRTERVHVEKISPIKRIDLNVNVNDLRNIKDNISDHIISANLYDSILDKWHDKKDGG